MEIMGVRVPTIREGENGIRCFGCGDTIDGEPWRVTILDTVAPETPAARGELLPVAPGPYEFHANPEHVLEWMAREPLLICRRSRIRSIMRPIPVPAGAGTQARFGLCDGAHLDEHELVEA
jgi:hypothetical protein